MSFYKKKNALLPEWYALPISLSSLLPNNTIEVSAILVTEDEACIIIINLCVNEERSSEINTIELSITNSKTRIAVHNLQNLSSLVENNPVRVDLGVSFGIKDNSLVLSEVGKEDVGIVRACVIFIRNAVTVRVPVTNVPTTITYDRTSHIFCWQIPHTESKLHTPI